MNGLAVPSRYVQSPAVAAILRSPQQLSANLCSSQLLPTVTLSFLRSSAVSCSPRQFPAVGRQSLTVAHSPRAYPSLQASNLEVSRIELNSCATLPTYAETQNGHECQGAYRSNLDKPDLS